MPAPTAIRTLAARGSAIARTCAAPYRIVYQAANAAARPDRRPAAAAATPTVPARVTAGRTGSAPETSRRDRAVTVYVCVATVSAAGTARVTRPPLAPSSTSSPRQSAITAGPAGVFLARRS